MKVPFVAFFGLRGGWFLISVVHLHPSANHFKPLGPCAISIACWMAIVAFVLVPFSSLFGLAIVHFVAPLTGTTAGRTQPLAQFIWTAGYISQVEFENPLSLGRTTFY